MKHTHIFAAAAMALALTACQSSTQTSSGTDYLARYDASYEPTKGGGSDVDADVRRIAAIEPDIRFPARIGLARISHGGLGDVPADEGYIWQALAEDLGPEYGEFVPVSPLIAGMVSDLGTQAPRSRGNLTARIIADIRRGAARQHLDYVLVYEVGSSHRDKANALALADLTIIGMFVLPSRSMTVEASASGILIDVRNGYPYATVTAHAEKGGITRTINSRSTAYSLADTTEERAVLNLAGEVRTVMQELSVVAAAAAE